MLVEPIIKFLGWLTTGTMGEPLVGAVWDKA
jgi:hypothetical protein